MQVTVAQLIESLSKMDPKAKVVYALDIDSYRPLVTVIEEHVVVAEGTDAEYKQTRAVLL
jgi:hypothetical protein